MSLYEDLGVSPDADEEALKRARNAAAKRHHPDQGSEPDPEKFDRAQRAYVVLADPERRAEYDRTGSTEKPGEGSEEAEARTILTQVILEAVCAVQQDMLGGKRRANLAHQDVRREIERSLGERAAQVAGEVDEGRKAIERLEEFSRRLSFKDGEENVIPSLICGQISMIKAHLTKGERQHRVHLRAIELIKQYDYRLDPAPARPGRGDARWYSYGDIA